MRIGLHTVIALVLFSAPLVSFIPNRNSNGITGWFGVYSLGSDELADDTRQGGMTYVIRQFGWDRIEPAQDVFRFDDIEEWYEDVMEPNNLAVVVNLRTRQSWATDNSDDSTLGLPLPESASAPPLDYNDYYDFIYTFVDHFRGEIEHIIIENDPITKYQWYGTPEEYKQLVSVAYRAAKDANPNCKVIGNKFPAMCFGYIIGRQLLEQGRFQEAIDFWNGYHSRRYERFQVDSIGELWSYLNSDFGQWAANFAEVILEPDQAENLDAIGFNYYLHYDYIDDVVEWLRARMIENGYTLPLLDLEHGVKDEREVVSDLQAAQDLVKGYTIAHSLDVPFVSWYPFTMDTASHNYEELKLMYDSYEEELLPPYYAMKTLAAHLTLNHKFHDKAVSFYSRYSFEDVTTGLIDFEVLWSDSVDSTLALSFPEPFNYAIVTNYLGNNPDTVARGKDSLEVEISTAPKLIRWKETITPTFHEPARLEP